MKYSFNTWAYSHFPCWVPAYPIEEVIRRLARIGYDALELGCAQPQAWPYFTDAAKRKDNYGRHGMTNDPKTKRNTEPPTGC